MKTATIKQSITFNASPAMVYSLLMDEKKLSACISPEAKMSHKLNGKFDIFDGYCSGYNIELIKDKKIVQAWHFMEDDWPDDHYSICTFLFEEKDDKTKLSFTQIDIPEHKAAALKEGWKEYFWEPMKAFLKGNAA